MSETTHHTPLRVYGRSELARLYYGRPISDSRARRWLMEELANQPGLMDEMRRRGFKKNGKIFSRTKMQAIFDALGEP